MSDIFNNLAKSPACLAFFKKLFFMSAVVLIIGLLMKSQIMIVLGCGTLVVTAIFGIPILICRRRQKDSADNDFNLGKQ